MMYGVSEISSPEDEDERAQVAMLESLWKDASEEQDVTPIKKDARDKPRPIRSSLDDSGDEGDFWDSIYAQEEWEEELQKKKEPQKTSPSGEGEKSDVDHTSSSSTPPPQQATRTPTSSSPTPSSATTTSPPTSVSDTPMSTQADSVQLPVIDNPEERVKEQEPACDRKRNFLDTGTDTLAKRKKIIGKTARGPEFARDINVSCEETWADVTMVEFAKWVRSDKDSRNEAAFKSLYKLGNSIVRHEFVRQKLADLNQKPQVATKTKLRFGVQQKLQ